MTRELTLEARAIPAPKDIADLLAMLTYMRPAKSLTETQFVKRFVVPLGTTPDAYGNHWRVIGKGSPILWSCHTDTVHKQAGTQSIEYGDGYVTTSSGSCLGADCGAGVWLMSRMIKAGIPGTYVFHRDEEIGGLGSAHIADTTPQKLEGIKFAIAFDRKGTRDIITHQACGRTASDAFATSLAEALGMAHTADDTGTFTDTANYASAVPECTNLSVGYYKQHTAGEILDVAYLAKLLKQILRADFSQLVCSRDPSIPDPDDWGQWYKESRYLDGPGGGKGVIDLGRDDMEQIVYDNPQGIASFLKCCGFSADDVLEYLDTL